MRWLLAMTALVILSCSFVNERSLHIGSRSLLSERMPVEDASGEVWWPPIP